MVEGSTRTTGLLYWLSFAESINWYVDLFLSDRRVILFSGNTTLTPLPEVEKRFHFSFFGCEVNIALHEQGLMEWQVI